MLRILRTRVTGVVHHVISRFVDRSWQLTGDDEREAYLHRLGHALARSDWTLLGYALMSSHVHLVLESGGGSIESWTKSAHSRMARWLNHRHGRLGPVFADRPYAEALAPDRVPYVLAYVHNNPVRARLVGWAGDTNWTSHRAYLGIDPSRARLCVQRGLDLCGYASDPEDRPRFDDWVRARAGEQLERLAVQVAKGARRSARQAVGAVAELATPQRSEQGLSFPIMVPTFAVGRAQLDLSAENVLAAIHHLLGVDARGRSARDHRPSIAQARRVALAVWQRTGRSRIEMARTLGIGASAASNLVHADPARTSHEMVERVWEHMRVCVLV